MSGDQFIEHRALRGTQTFDIAGLKIARRPRIKEVVMRHTWEDVGRSLNAKESKDSGATQKRSGFERLNDRTVEKCLRELLKPINTSCQEWREAKLGSGKCRVSDSCWRTRLRTASRGLGCDPLASLIGLQRVPQG